MPLGGSLEDCCVASSVFAVAACSSCCDGPEGQLRQAPEVLSNGDQCELVLRALWSSQSQRVGSEDAFEMGEQNLNFAAFVLGLLMLFGLCQSPCHVTRGLIDTTCHLPPCRVWTASIFELACLTVAAIGKVAQCIIGILPPDLLERLACRTDVSVGLAVEPEVGP